MAFYDIVYDKARLRIFVVSLPTPSFRSRCNFKIILPHKIKLLRRILSYAKQEALYSKNNSAYPRLSEGKENMSLKIDSNKFCPCPFCTLCFGI